MLMEKGGLPVSVMAACGFDAQVQHQKPNTVWSDPSHAAQSPEGGHLCLRLREPPQPLHLPTPNQTALWRVHHQPGQGQHHGWAHRKHICCSTYEVVSSHVTYLKKLWRNWDLHWMWVPNENEAAVFCSWSEQRELPALLLHQHRAAKRPKRINNNSFHHYPLSSPGSVDGLSRSFAPCSTLFSPLPDK